LPIPSIIDGRNGGLFTIGISQFDQWLGLVDPATKAPLQTKVWGYNGSYPGPTILAQKKCTYPNILAKQPGRWIK
jgi:hypothetical protein